jgi:CHAT domain-containing protein
VAASLNAPVESLLIGEKATESEVKRKSMTGELAGYRVVHFATLGLLASETELFAREIDPALILTPPQQPSESDDGLITASEIAGLRLDADLVILSACNTAAADGNSRDALSGLARAFFYAGARSILVSHWEVLSVAAVKLVTLAFAELTAAERGGHRIGRAEAMRRSMADVVAEGGLAAHPAYWGAFSLVGEGSSPLN